MARIDYYLFPLSPFTYLAGNRLEEIAASHGADIEYKPFALPKVFEAHGTPALPQRHEVRKAYRLAEIKRIAEMHDMPVNVQPRHFPTNPVPACTAIISAQMVAADTGKGDVGKLVQNFLRACWAEEKDIAEDHVVRACLEAAGFDAGVADRDMLSAVEIYEKNTQDALDIGVFGAPTYYCDNELFWGQDRLSYLDRKLAKAR